MSGWSITIHSLKKAWRASILNKQTTRYKSLISSKSQKGQTGKAAQKNLAGWRCQKLTKVKDMQPNIMCYSCWLSVPILLFTQSLCGLPLIWCLKHLNINFRTIQSELWSVISYSSFNLKLKYLQCKAKTKQQILMFQNFLKWLYIAVINYLSNKHVQYDSHWC